MAFFKRDSFEGELRAALLREEQFEKKVNECERDLDAARRNRHDALEAGDDAVIESASDTARKAEGYLQDAQDGLDLVRRQRGLIEQRIASERDKQRRAEQAVAIEDLRGKIAAALASYRGSVETLILLLPLSGPEGQLISTQFRLHLEGFTTIDGIVNGLAWQRDELTAQAAATEEAA
jgi:hypothetical protein